MTSCSAAQKRKNLNDGVSNETSSPKLTNQLKCHFGSFLSDVIETSEATDSR